MTLLSTDALREFEQMGLHHRLSFLVDLFKRYPSEAQAQEGAAQIIAVIQQEGIPSQGKWYDGAEWLLHDWLVCAVHSKAPAWAKALLDQGANPSLTSSEADWGGGQALREALDQPNFDPVLLERLWALTDMKNMIAVLTHRVARVTKTEPDTFFGRRYAHHVDCVAARHFADPDIKPLLEPLIAQLSTDQLPLYTQARQAASPT